MIETIVNFVTPYWIVYLDILFITMAVASLYVATEVFLMKDGFLRKMVFVIKFGYGIVAILMLIYLMNRVLPYTFFPITCFLWIIIYASFAEGYILSLQRRTKHRVRNKRAIDQLGGFVEATMEVVSRKLSLLEGDVEGVFGGYTKYEVFVGFPGEEDGTNFLSDVTLETDYPKLEKAWDSVIDGTHSTKIIDYRIIGKDKDIHWVRQAMVAVRDTYGHIVAVDISCESITDLKNAQVELEERNRRLTSLLNVSRMVQTTYDEIASFALEECVKLTRSEVGYMHFVNPEGTIKLYLWSKEALQLCSTDTEIGHYPLNEAGIWADCIREHQTVIHNDYVLLNRQEYLPEGHFKVIRHMSVPIISHGTPIAVIGVGNKETPYTKKDQEQLELYVEELWSILQRTQTTTALREHEHLLNQLINNSAAMIWAKDLNGKYIVMNEAACSGLYHLPYDAALEKDDIELIQQRAKNDPELTPEWVKHYIALVKQSDQHVYDVGHFREQESIVKDGHLHIYDVQKSVVRDKENNPIGTVGGAIEITDQVQMTNRNRMLSSALNYIKEGLVIYRQDTYENIFVNHQQGLFFKQSCRMLTGGKVDVFYPDSVKTPERELQLVLGTYKKTCLVVKDIHNELSAGQFYFIPQDDDHFGPVMLRIHQGISNTIFSDFRDQDVLYHLHDSELAILLIAEGKAVIANKVFTRLLQRTVIQLNELDNLVEFLGLNLDELIHGIDVSFIAECHNGLFMWKAVDSLQGTLLFGMRVDRVNG